MIYQNVKNMESSLPSISVVIPTLNEEEALPLCLRSIKSQDYPSELIEIIVVDNQSTDNTIKIVEEYEKKYGGISLIFNDIAKDAELSKMIGLRKAKGDLFIYLDADIEIVGNDWIKKLVKPLVIDSQIVGSFPRFIPNPKEPAIGRYLRYHPLELDPFLQFFCTKIEDTVIAVRDDFQVCRFRPPRIPPIGICLYRRGVLIDVLKDVEKFMDVDVPVILSKRGYDKFAYVPSAGFYHVNMRGLKDLVQRRLRQITKTYLPNIESREFRYFDHTNKKDIFKLIVWIIYSHLFIPLLIKGVYKSLKNWDFACMYEPIIAMASTDATLYAFLANKRGREIVKKSIWQLFRQS
jgi:glycosyltransferase involved in cell wall biosynthesis